MAEIFGTSIDEIEAAVFEGALPEDVLKILKK